MWIQSLVPQLQFHAIRQFLKVAIREPIRFRFANDWIEHQAFGLGRVSEDRGDRPDIILYDSRTSEPVASIMAAHDCPNSDPHH